MNTEKHLINEFGKLGLHSFSLSLKKKPVKGED